MRITVSTELCDPRRQSHDGRFDVPVPDFCLTRLELAGQSHVQDAGPRIALCTSGTVRVDDVEIAPGGAAFIPAGMPAVVSGDGVVLAGVGA